MEPTTSAPRSSTPVIVILALWMFVVTLVLAWQVIEVWPMAASAMTPLAKTITDTAPAGQVGAAQESSSPGKPGESPPRAPAVESATSAKTAPSGSLAEKTDPALGKDAVVVLILLLGAAGAQIHALQSFSDFVGNGTFASRWVFWYMKRPLIGALLALAVYAVIGGGVIGLDATLGEAGGNLWGLAGICLLSGMFSRLVTDKLREVFTTLLAVGPGEQPQRKDPMKEPARLPVVEKLEPAAVSAAAPVPVKVTGRNFTKDGKARIGDQPVEVGFISATEWEIPAASLPTKPGKYGVVVVNGASKAGSSAAAELEITA